ncbi:MAG: efflux RND transporter periplasmic adaptor subunit [Gemmatimonadetes bacterium]|nr:efflux RND transporter periplasmic adaptor subunit [Gemmatimonadota bacterium]
MKHRKAWMAVGLAAVVLVTWGLVTHSEGTATSYRFVTVSRGDVESVVTATGSLEATETVEVGTQVSGQIAELLVDFNDQVEAGQLLARIDPTILQQEVRSAEANLARNRAEMQQAERELKRSEELYAKQVVTDAEHDQATYSYEVATAAYASAEIGLERARRNLQYTEVRAPNDGVVVARNVDVGQTVAASLSAPTLFIIAQDLSEMEILASVDESDIGQIEDGQQARFTVRAYPDRQFTGNVRQVRLQSTTQENVVNYSVVIGVENEEGLLLPGMTATVEFIIDRAEDVLTVPNTALRFRATEEMRAALASRLDAAPAADSPADRGEARGGDGPAPEGGPSRPPRDAASSESGPVMLWYLAADGELAVAPVRTGLSNGQATVINSRDAAVVEGLQVIAAVTEGTAPETAAANPFQNNSGQDSRRGPGGGFR